MPKKLELTSTARGINVGSEYNEEQQRFLYEINRFKQTSGKSYMTELDAFRVAMAMGYRREHTAEPKADQN
jgi:hypothetical protein